MKSSRWHQKQHASFSIWNGRRKCTCVYSLPANREGSPCLHRVHGDGAVVVRCWAPGQLHSGIGDVSHRWGLRGPWRTYYSRNTRQCEPHCRKTDRVTLASCSAPSFSTTASKWFIAPLSWEHRPHQYWMLQVSRTAMNNKVAPKRRTS